jgi:phosphoribosylformylglycinamidine synthase subunit PurS
MLEARVLVRLKEGVLDPAGQAVRSGLHQLGFEAVKEVRLGKVVEIVIDTDSRDEAALQIERMCEQLLANPVIEGYSVEFK